MCFPDSPADAIHAATQAIAVGNIRVAYETIMATNPIQPALVARVVNLTGVCHDLKRLPKVFLGIASLEKITRDMLTRVVALATTSMNSELIGLCPVVLHHLMLNRSFDETCCGDGGK